MTDTYKDEERVDAMSIYKVIPLCLGHIQRPKTNMVYNCGDTTLTDFPLISYYLESAEHKIIVDTGGTAPDGKKWMPYQRRDQESMESQLAAIHVDPKDIDTVILTHLHWDHAGNNELFTNAKFYVQKKECEDFHQPGVDAEVVARTEYTLVDGDVELYPGIQLILAPGHSPGMQCVLVSTDSGKKMIMGDLIPMYENWEAEPKIPNGGFYDLEVIRNSVKKTAGLCDEILPGHDHKVFGHE